MEVNEPEPAAQPASASPEPKTTDAPIPLSFPALLRNPGIRDRYGHLLESKPSRNSSTTSTRTSYRKSKHDNEGRRWIRRKENALFVGNPHITSATRKDYTLSGAVCRSTFPEPLPAYLHRNSKIPTNPVPVTDPVSADAGRFSLSLKGMRRDLRRAGFRSEVLVRDIEGEILDWLDAGGIILNPDLAESIDHSAGRVVGNTGTVFEVSRTPQQLVWRTADDAFARYVVHCCARFHNVVSFSKELSGTRLTYLLRPNVTRPDRRMLASLVTPPTTDLDDSSHFDSESEFTSSVADSDVESVASRPAAQDLSDIDEQSLPDDTLQELDTDAWSVVGESDADGEISEGEDLAASLDSLSMRSDDPDRTLETISPGRQPSFRPSVRSSSSPSRSPARHTPRRPLHDPTPTRKKVITLYDFVYS